MVFGVQFLQPLPRHMRINLRRRNIRMAQQQLHYPQVRPMVDQVCCEGMSQRVRGERLLDAGDRSIAPDEVLECLSRHRPAARGDEDRVR